MSLDIAFSIKQMRWCLLVLLLVACSTKNNVLIIAPTPNGQRLAEQFPYECHFYPVPFILDQHYDLELIVDNICEYARTHHIDGILSSDDYAGTPLASICAQKLGLAGPTPLSVITCQHKYYSRLAQQQCVPEATASFTLVHEKMAFPCFVKPIKSFFSMYAQEVQSADEIKRPEPIFFDFFDQLVAYCTSFHMHEEHMLAEEILSGAQVTWEGSIFHGQVNTIGIVDSI